MIHTGLRHRLARLEARRSIGGPDPVETEELRRLIQTAVEAVERILGAPEKLDAMSPIERVARAHQLTEGAAFPWWPALREKRGCWAALEIHRTTERSHSTARRESVMPRQTPCSSRCNCTTCLDDPRTFCRDRATALLTPWCPPRGWAGSTRSGQRNIMVVTLNPGAPIDGSGPYTPATALRPRAPDQARKDTQHGLVFRAGVPAG